MKLFVIDGVAQWFCGIISRVLVVYQSFIFVHRESLGLWETLDPF